MADRVEVGVCMDWCRIRSVSMSIGLGGGAGGVFWVRVEVDR